MKKLLASQLGQMMCGCLSFISVIIAGGIYATGPSSVTLSVFMLFIAITFAFISYCSFVLKLVWCGPYIQFKATGRSAKFVGPIAYIPLGLIIWFFVLIS